MTRISALAAATALAVLAGGTAMAQGPSGHRGTVLDFTTIDSDGNGSLGRAELQAHAGARLARADANGDGALDREELLVLMPGRDGAPFRIFSVDPDTARVDRLLAMLGATEAGQVELTAFADHRVNMLLAAVDTDRDAAISQAEADARAEARAHRHGRDHARGDHDGRRAFGPHHGDCWGRDDGHDGDRRGPGAPQDRAEGMMAPPAPPSPPPAPDAAPPAPGEPPLPGAPDQP